MNANDEATKDPAERRHLTRPGQTADPVLRALSTAEAAFGRNEVLGIIRFCERHHGIMGSKEGGAA